MHRIPNLVWISTICAAVGFTPLHAGEPGHSDDLVVGRTGAGQLSIESGAFGRHFPLPPVSGLVNGFALDEPGILTLEADEPEEDFFQLAAGANIRFDLVSISPAMKIYTPGFADTLDMAGETWTLGSAPFHEHPTWHIDSDDAAYNASQLKWQVTFRVIDTGTTAYAPSPDYTMIFTNVDSTIPAMSARGAIVLVLAVLAGGVVLFKREGLALRSTRRA